MPNLQMQTPKTNAPGLIRQLGFFSATALVISNMVGMAIFTSTGYMAGALGSAALVLACWGVGALFALAGALSYSELGINFPSSGGEYVYLSRAFGPEWGFMTGWVSFFAGFSAPIAAAALAFADYLSHIFPALRQDNALVFGPGAFKLHLGAAQFTAAALIAAFTALNCFGVGRTAKVQNVLTSTKLIVVIGFIVLGFASGAGNWSHFTEPTARTSSSPLAMAFLVEMLWVMVGYSGWNAATYVAEEVRRPERTLPLALAVGTGVVAVLYIGLNMVFIYATPLSVMAKAEMAPGALSAINLFGPSIGGVWAALMALCLVSTVNAEVTVGPRVYYAMAKNRAFFSAAARVHPRFHTPIVAIVSQGVCAILMTATPFPDLVNYIGMSLTLFTVLSVASLLVFRRRQSGWQRLRAIDFAFPLIPALYILVGTAMVIFGLKEHPLASLSAFATVGAGALVYRFGVRPAA